MRAASAAAAAPNDEVEDRRSKAGSITFQVVEMLAGSGWLVTCWHAPRKFTGSEETPGVRPLGDHADGLADIEQSWASSNGRTAGDLGPMVVARGHLPGRAPVAVRLARVVGARPLPPLNAARGKARDYWFADVSETARPSASTTASTARCGWSPS